MRKKLNKEELLAIVRKHIAHNKLGAVCGCEEEALVDELIRYFENKKFRDHIIYGRKIKETKHE